MGKLLSIISIFSLLLIATAAQAVTIDLVPVGNPGNANDPETGYGGVDYSYLIGQFEITAGQYCDFLNAVAKTDTYDLYNPNMDYDADPSRLGCNIRQTGSSGNYSYSVAADWINRPVNYVSWGDAARFVNWLSNGQPIGGQNLLTTEDGSYYLNGAMSEQALMTVTRKPNAKWAIPSENEWYKAAYHKNDGMTDNYFDYPTKSDTEPINTLSDQGNNANFDVYDGTIHTPTIGGPYWRTEVGAFEYSESPYGTNDQGGNVQEWNDNTDGWGVIRGGSCLSSSETLHASFRYINQLGRIDERNRLGLRIAYIPEPSGVVLVLSTITVLVIVFGKRWIS